MSNELTKEATRKRTIKRMTILVCVILIVVLGWFASVRINANLREQSEIAVRNAILNSAKQCFAIEGAYPTSILYLEENYGLVVNQNDYAITYTPMAANVMPSVVVVAK